MKNDDELIALLRKATDEAGSQRKWCRAHNIAPWRVSYILRGRLPMQPSIATALGYKLDHYERVGFWEEVKKK